MSLQIKKSPKTTFHSATLFEYKICINMSVNSDMQEFPIIAWKAWVEEIFPYLNKSGSILSMVLNFKKISRYYHKKVDEYIKSVIDDVSATTEL